MANAYIASFPHFKMSFPARVFSNKYIVSAFWNVTNIKSLASKCAHASTILNINSFGHCPQMVKNTKGSCLCQQLLKREISSVVSWGVHLFYCQFSLALNSISFQRTSKSSEASSPPPCCGRTHCRPAPPRTPPRNSGTSWSPPPPGPGP